MWDMGGASSYVPRIMWEDWLGCMQNILVPDFSSAETPDAEQMFYRSEGSSVCTMNDKRVITAWDDVQVASQRHQGAGRHRFIHGTSAELRDTLGRPLLTDVRLYNTSKERRDVAERVLWEIGFVACLQGGALLSSMCRCSSLSAHLVGRREPQQQSRGKKGSSSTRNTAYLKKKNGFIRPYCWFVACFLFVSVWYPKVLL